MSKNPWTYKRRKKRQRKKSIEDGDFIENSRNLSNPEIHVGSIKSEILVSPFKQFKKEFNYPDTRFQSSTTLFPAMELKSLQSEIPSNTSKLNIEQEKSSEQEAECVELYRVPVEVNSEISQLNNYLLKNETIDLDVRSQFSTTLFPPQNIENIILLDKPNKTFKPDPDARTKCVTQEKELIEHYQKPVSNDTVVSISVMSEIPLSNSIPVKNKDKIYSDRFQCTPSHFLAQEIENIIKLEKPSENLKHDSQSDAFELPSKKGKLPVSDDCVIIENPNSQVEIDLTGNSYQIISQFIVLD